MWLPRSTRKGGLWLPGQPLAMAGKFRFMPCPMCCSPHEQVDCNYCNEGTGPGHIQVTVDGIVNHDCSYCAEFNGTFILDRFWWDPDLDCYYYYDFDPRPCWTQDSYQFWFSPAYIRCMLYIYGSHTIWQAAWSPPQDCMIDALNLPLASDLKTFCDASSATCVATAL